MTYGRAMYINREAVHDHGILSLSIQNSVNKCRTHRLPVHHAGRPACANRDWFDEDAHCSPLAALLPCLCIPAGPRSHRAHEPNAACICTHKMMGSSSRKRCRSARLTRVQGLIVTECEDCSAHRELRRGTGAGRRRWMTQSPDRTPSARTTAPARKTKRSIYVRSKPCDIASEAASSPS